MTNTTCLGLAVAILFATGCGGSGQPNADSAKAAPLVLSPQDLATAQTMQIGGGIVLSGNLDPVDVVVVKAQVPGTVTGVRVDRGSRVAKGQMMAVIEAQGIRSQAAGAQAQVVAANAQLSLARQRLEGAKRLYEAGAISAIDYKTAQANVEVAEAQAAAARAQAAGAGESAARATIVSPIGGIVSDRRVSGGEAVAVGDDLFTVVNASELELTGQVGVQEAARVRIGQPVTFTLDAYPNQVFRGRVARIDPTADPGTRQVGVYVRLPNPAQRIVGGQYARGRIETGSGTTSVVIPESAVANRAGDSAQVFVVVGNKLARRTVKTGDRDEASGTIAVLSGIQAGERVLLNPSPDIGDGAVVSVAADRPAAPAPADSGR